MILVSIMRRFFRFGRLTVIDPAGKRHAICDREGPTVVMRVHDRKTEMLLATSNSTFWGEAYMDGRLTFEEGTLREFFEVFKKSEIIVEAGNIGEIVRVFYSILAAVEHYNPVGRAQKNVAHHYDLSSELYDLFLDADRQYSCAYFPAGDEDIETAQQAKKRHIAAKLAIEPGMRVLDIGSGWGGMGIYLAKQFDCEVTGVTLSTEQLKIARERARDAGLEDRVHFELQDYRELDDRFDRIVSVGMLEHVGQFHYGEYFGKVRELLKADGVALIHTIGRMGKPMPVSSWVRKYIFPGGYLPTASQLTRAIENKHLWLTDFENLRIHYAETLDRWYTRFMQNRDEIAKLYDERFCRMWELYLLGSEAIFRYQDISVFQMQITRDINTLPITRDYLFDNERELAQRDSATVTSIKPGKKQAAGAAEGLEAS